MHNAVKNKTAQGNTHPPGSFRFLARINTTISDKISRPEYFSRNLQESCWRALALEASYQLSEGSNLANSGMYCQCTVNTN